MRRFLHPVAIISAVITLTSCGPAPLPGTVRMTLQDQDLGRIGVISAAVQPDTDISGLPPAGAAAGAITGTAAGAVIGAFECLIFLYPFVPAYPICMAVLATAGTTAGMVTAEPAEVVAAAQEKFTGVLTERDWQTLLRQDIVQLATERYRINASDLGAPGPRAEKPGAAAGAQESVPVPQAEASHTSHAVSATPTTQTDTLMEVSLQKLATWFSGNHKFGFVLTGRAQLIRNSDLVVLASSTHHYVSPSLPLPEWIERDGVLIRETVTAGVGYLAQEMVREHLHEP